MSLSDNSSVSSESSGLHAEDDVYGSHFNPQNPQLSTAGKDGNQTPVSAAGGLLASGELQQLGLGRATGIPEPPATLKQRFVKPTPHHMFSLHVGAEPGIDPRRASANLHYGHIHQQCEIEVIDYSPDNCSFGHMKNQQLIDMLNSPVASEREPWANVRWINVGGVSWDVISALAMRYDMHPLAIEDMIHQHGRGRSKADYYPKHLFLRILCHKLAPEDDFSLDASLGHVPVDPTSVPRSESPEPMDMDEKGHYVAEEDHSMPGALDSSTNHLRHSQEASALDVEAAAAAAKLSRPGPPIHRASSAFVHFARKRQRHAEDWKLIQKLKKGERINVKLNPVCIFLFRDGTVIAISQESNLDWTAPIRDRLREEDTVLRVTSDASLLVESLIDLIVDQALVVVEEYQGRLLKVEKAILLKPDMNTVTSLHMIQEDLILHKRTLDPIKTLVFGLRRYDASRAAAVAASGDLKHDSDVQPAGFMSAKARIYLADVYDHLEYILNSLDMFASVSDNLINYTCNMVSYQMNEVMRRLTLITMIFLPLSFLSGYFGMNFSMWSTSEHTDVFYWEVSLPVMVALLPMFMWPDFKRMAHYLEKRVIKRQATNASS